MKPGATILKALCARALTLIKGLLRMEMESMTGSLKSLSMGWVGISGTVGRNTMDNGKTTALMDWVLTNGLMVDYTKANGRRITCTGSAFIHSQTEELTWVNIKTISSMATVCINLLMVDTIVAIGQRAKEMDLGHFIHLKISNTVFGKMASNFNGLVKNK